MRLHHSARAPKKATKVTSLRGTVKDSTTQLVPVTEGLVACPTCQGGVKLIGASFTDTEAGISYQKTKLYSSHVYGGARSLGYDNRCPSSHAKAAL
jgi:hypothetical protein